MAVLQWYCPHCLIADTARLTCALFDGRRWRGALPCAPPFGWSGGARPRQIAPGDLSTPARGTIYRSCYPPAFCCETVSVTPFDDFPALRTGGKRGANYGFRQEFCHAGGFFPRPNPLHYGAVANPLWSGTQDAAHYASLQVDGRASPARTCRPCLQHPHRPAAPDLASTGQPFLALDPVTETDD